jgi:WD40 repeat protein
VKKRAARFLIIALVLASLAAAWSGRAVYRARRVLVLGGERGVSSVIFSPDGNTLAVGTSAGVVELWDWEAERLEAKVGDRGWTITEVAFAPDGRSLALVRDDATLEVFERDGRRLLHRPALRSNGRCSVAVPASGALAAVSRPGGVALVLADGQERLFETNPPYLFAPSRVRFSPGGDTLAATYGEGFVVWSVATGARLAERDIPAGIDGVTLAATPAGFLRTVGSSDFGWVEVRSLPRDELDARIDVGAATQEIPDAVALAAAGDLIAVSVPERVRVFDLRDGREVATFRGEPESRCRALAFSPTRDVLAVTWEIKVQVFPIRR